MNIPAKAEEKSNCEYQEGREHRIAFVVGVDDYSSKPNNAIKILGLGNLDRAKKDADKVAESLKKVGFCVYRLENPNITYLLVKLADLQRSAKPDSVVVFYFSGHAFMNSGITYLVLSPSENDGNNPNCNKNQTAVPMECIDKVAISLENDIQHRLGRAENTSNGKKDDNKGFTLENDIQHRLKRAENTSNGKKDDNKGFTIVIIDACRTQSPVKIEQGENEYITDSKTLIAYATLPGRSAYEGIYKSYADYLSELVTQSDLSVSELFDQLANRISEDTKKYEKPQIPQIHKAITPDLYLGGKLPVRMILRF